MSGEKSPATHAVFLEGLRASHGAVWRLAQWLNARGHHVRINASSAATTHEQWKNHVDIGDIEITQRCEVKWLGVDFTGRDDWPYGHNFLVCSSHSFDNAFPKPVFYFYLNRAMSHVAWIDAKATRESWRTEMRTDGRTEVPQQFYLCPIESVTWWKLEGGDAV